MPELQKQYVNGMALATRTTRAASTGACGRAEVSYFASLLLDSVRLSTKQVEKKGRAYSSACCRPWSRFDLKPGVSLYLLFSISKGLGKNSIIINGQLFSNGDDCAKDIEIIALRNM